MQTHHYWIEAGVFYRHPFGEPEQIEQFVAGQWRTDQELAHYQIAWGLAKAA